MKLDINKLERKWAISNSRHHEPEAPCYGALGMKGCPCCDADEFLATQWDSVIAALREGERLRDAISSIRQKLEQIVCTAEPDKGVVLLSNDGPTHWDETVKCQVYDHEHFSPLGDALIELHEMTKLDAAQSPPKE